MRKYPVSYEEWASALDAKYILPRELRGRFNWRDIHPTTASTPENYQAYVSFLALHSSKLGKLLQGIDDV
jgi:formylglycine-generating enzyme required for sulfatase activity